MGTILLGRAIVLYVACDVYEPVHVHKVSPTSACANHY